MNSITKNDLAWAASAGVTGCLTGLLLFDEKAFIIGGLFAVDSLISVVAKPHFDRLENDYKKLAPFLGYTERIVCIASSFHILGLASFTVTLTRVAIAAASILGGVIGKHLLDVSDAIPSDAEDTPRRVIEATTTAAITGCLLDFSPLKTVALVSFYALRAIAQLKNREVFHPYDSGLKNIQKWERKNFDLKEFGPLQMPLVAIKINFFVPALFVCFTALICIIVGGTLKLYNGRRH